MIAVPSHVAHGERSLRRNLLLDAQAPGDDGRRGKIGLHIARRNLGGGRRRNAGREIQARYRDGLDGFRGVERRGLVKPVVERVEQAVIKPDAAAHRGLAIAPHVPGKAQARIGQELGAVGPERRAADDRRRLQHAIDDRVIRGAALRLVPSVGRLRRGSPRALPAAASP